MPEPNDSPCLPNGTTLTPHPNGQYTLSNSLVELLLQARNKYDWPRGTGARASQNRILELLTFVNNKLKALSPDTAHAIIVAVSEWAHNNAKTHANIVGATPPQRDYMLKAISRLITPGQEREGITRLCNLPGINLVIASKIFRFCAPNQGAAVDRHTSYFFNSLQFHSVNTVTYFVRQWSNGCHATSRLSVYTRANFNHNEEEYFSSYLPKLTCIAAAMNTMPVRYTCAARNTDQNWTPADVEMAAYYWWAIHGAR